MSYEYQYVRFKSNDPIVYSGAYTTNMDYDLVDGVNVGSSGYTSDGSVTANGRYFTVNSQFNTGINFTSVRTTPATSRNVSFKIKLSAYPSTTQTLFQAGSNIFCKITSSGGLIISDAFGVGQTETTDKISLNAWTSIGLDVIWGAVQSVAVWFCDESTNNLTLFDPSNITYWGGGTIPTDDLILYDIGGIEFFNLIASDFFYSKEPTYTGVSKNGKWNAYAGTLVQETYPITFPDGSNDTEFIICTQPENLGYGASGRKIFNKALSISDISYNAENGISNLQNCKITISNTGQFYQLMRELNGFDFWPSLQVDIYWASGRVPTLVYDGADWKEDGETLISFTPDETYPLIDSIKKEFSGRFDSGSISKDTATFNLVSQEKMDSYKIGTIESMFGADSSKGKINPIVIGDMTNEFAYVPVILDRSLYDVPTAICSDIDLSEQPTLHIYDDEAERYYDVLNEQTFIDNRKIAFVDDTLIESVTAYTTGHVVMNGDISAEKILKDENGEYFGRFGDNLPYVSINKTVGGAFDYLAFIQNDYSIQRTYEGTRNYTGTIFENGKTVESLTVSKDMAKAKALVNLEFKPVVFYNVPDEQEDFDAIASAEFYTRVTKAGGVDTAGKPYQTNAIGTGPNPNSSQQMASTGRVKDVLNYEDWESTNYPHSDVTNLESPLSYLIFAPVHGVWSSNALDGNEYSLWSDYNYYTFSRQRLGFDLTPCKFDGDVKQFNINVNGGFYSKFYWGDGEPDGQKLTNSEAPAFAFSAKNENTNALDYHYIETRPITITSEFDDYSKEIKSTFQLDWFSTINGIKNSSPSIVMQGWSITSPFNVISGPRDYSRGRFGRNYFALDGVRLLAQASLNVESKYWCFKGKTASTDLITCLNELGAKYGNTTYVGTGVTGMKISGAIVGDPIYYRDVIAKIAEEFYCFVYDKNGVSYVVKKGSGSDVGNIDESNIIGPWVDNISFSETPANEIYDRFVVRYNYNHMTEKYGSFLEWNPDLFSTEISSPSRVSLYEAQQYLSKIGQSGKTKTVDLQFVRDVDTAVNIGEKWVQNIVRQRPKVTINVSKNVFLNMNIGDKFYLNLDVPSFYKTYYSVTKIVNRSNKTLTIEGEAFN